MYEPVFETLRTVTEATAQAQKELFQKWAGLWPGCAAAPAGGQAAKAYTKWAETVRDTLQRQRAVVEDQFKAGLASIESAFAVGQAKSPEELRAKTAELWQKCFDTVRHAYEAQVREMQVTADKWAELVTKPVA
jgi:hypothetical protein